ncbi:MAG: hypothetical protein FWD75_06350 [Propionibacteriaceae bacterium]|nr:hypothetical protein [Propionibacteriaceae bacterium]
MGIRSPVLLAADENVDNLAQIAPPVDNSSPTRDGLADRRPTSPTPKAEIPYPGQ